MDAISQLPDDLIVRILSLLPTKDVLAVSCLKKRWWSIGNQVPRLEFDDQNHYDNDSFRQFVYKTLLLNKAPNIELLSLNVGPTCDAGDVRIWIDAAVSHRVRKLIVKFRLGYFWSWSPMRMPSSLFTCKTLESLTLVNCQVVPCCLPSLKSLKLWEVSYGSLSKFLSGCPNLDYLGVNMADALYLRREEREDLIAEVPLLRTLDLYDSRYGSQGGVFVIEAPCLETLQIIDYVVYNSRQIENMPNLVKAHVDIFQEVSLNFLRALASARSLSLCVSLLSEVSSEMILFNQLLHLELNTCAQGWWKVLTYMLENSPNLTSLKLTDSKKKQRRSTSKETPVSWTQPSSIPESLETFEWIGYSGKQGNFAVATYVIKNACRLKSATFSPQSDCGFEAKYRMLKDLLSVFTFVSVTFRMI